MTVAVVTYGQVFRRLLPRDTCPYPGFFRDAFEPPKFYRCAHLSTITKSGNILQKYEFRCSPGTVFDERFAICNYDYGDQSPSQGQGSASNQIQVSKTPASPKPVPTIQDSNNSEMTGAGSKKGSKETSDSSSQEEGGSGTENKNKNLKETDASGLGDKTAVMGVDRILQIIDIPELKTTDGKLLYKIGEVYLTTSKGKLATIIVPTFVPQLNGFVRGDIIIQEEATSLSS